MGNKSGFFLKDKSVNQMQAQKKASSPNCCR